MVNQDSPKFAQEVKSYYPTIVAL
ncbi:MAG: hypothetical protein RL228_426, partial [Actinomycetota bacterium]